MLEQLFAPEVTEEALRARVARLLRWHERHAAELFMRAPQAIARAATILRHPEHPLRRQALQSGRLVGLSPGMVAEAIENALGGLTAQRLVKLRQRHVGPEALGRRHLPRLVFHVLAGNLFLSGWESMILASLTGACQVVRTSAQDRIYARLWARALAAADPLLGKAHAVYWWPHEDSACTRAATHAADVVVAFGDDPSVGAVRALTPVRTRFVGHGFKLSFALLDTSDLREDCLDDLARRLAYDFSVYDQQGCLSPRALLLGGREIPIEDQFCAALATAMRNYLTALPRHELTLEEKAVVARLREETLLEHLAAGRSQSSRRGSMESAKLWSRPDDPFVVAQLPLGQFVPSPVNRSVTIYRFRSLDQLTQVLLPYRGHISTLGVENFHDAWQRLACALQVVRICPIGKMQKPPLGWTHDGYQPLEVLCPPIELSELTLRRRP